MSKMTRSERLARVANLISDAAIELDLATDADADALAIITKARKAIAKLIVR